MFEIFSFLFIYQKIIHKVFSKMWDNSVLVLRLPGMFWSPLSALGPEQGWTELWGWWCRSPAQPQRHSEAPRPGWTAPPPLDFPPLVSPCLWCPLCAVSVWRGNTTDWLADNIDYMLLLLQWPSSLTTFLSSLSGSQVRLDSIFCDNFPTISWFPLFDSLRSSF